MRRTQGKTESESQQRRAPHKEGSPSNATETSRQMRRSPAFRVVQLLGDPVSHELVAGTGSRWAEKWKQHMKNSPSRDLG